MGAPVVWHVASMVEEVAHTVPDAPAVVQGSVRRSYRELVDRASRLASAFLAAGVSADAKVALFMHNRVEYLEAHLAACHIRAVPINVSYRYQRDELRHLLDDADAEAVVFDAALAPHVATVAADLPRLKLLVRAGSDGADDEVGVAYEELVATHEPAPPAAWDADDVYMLYTGGTTGLPKGVMYAHRDHTRKLLEMMAAMLGTEGPVDAELGVRVASQLDIHNAERPVWLPACPLMHTAGMLVGGTCPHLVGGTVVLLEGSSFDAHELWTTVERESVNAIVVVGDAFGRPMVRALEEAEAAGHPHDLASLKIVFSAGATMSGRTKESLLDRLPDGAMVVDMLGSTEGGMGATISARGQAGESTRFSLNPTVDVLDADGRPVEAGSGAVGRIAIREFVPLGYYKDPERSARTFPVINGTRYSLPGDWATVEADGTVTLLGRGSRIVNTGGEKVFCEEVEEAIKTHPAVEDCLVLGRPDEQFGTRVAAVVAATADLDVEGVRQWVKKRLAGYKAPREIAFVATVPRQPTGKPDYDAANVLLDADDSRRLSHGPAR